MPSKSGVQLVSSKLGQQSGSILSKTPRLTSSVTLDPGVRLTYSMRLRSVTFAGVAMATPVTMASTPSKVHGIIVIASGCLLRLDWG
jgi:hypothetical protein